MLDPRAIAKTPDSGTAIKANSTPCEAAYVIGCFKKWLAPPNKKISG
jgi:hypothetical protein